jgi:acyl carrier protein
MDLSGRIISTAPTLRGRLVSLIRQILGAAATARPLPLDVRLADLGMSSIQMVTLMLSVESEFQLTIPPQEITPENFASISSVEAMLLRLTASAGGL